MPKKDPWKCYGPQVEEDSWIILGAEIIPLPPNRCPDLIPDWVVKGLPKDPTPYDMPVFVIGKIIMRWDGRKRVTIYKVQSPATRAIRDFLELKEKWRPAPPPLSDESEEPVILSRYKRPPVI
jgi:hypothetical protein